MSKIGKKAIKIPRDVNTEIGNNFIIVSRGEKKLTFLILKGVTISKEADEFKFLPEDKSAQTRGNWGTLRSLVANAIEGLTKGFEKTLVLEGVGYRITKEGSDLALTLGFSHPVKYKAREGISFDVEKNTVLKIRGFDKALVGQVASEIRSLKKPEPYKGKGFRYAEEVIRRKAGKKAVAASGGGTAQQ